MSKRRVAVIGGGVSGLVSAYELSEADVEVVLYEKEDFLGGHVKTLTIDDYVTCLDLGFNMVFNRVTSPNMMEFFDKLGVEVELSDMSFSVTGQGGCEWGTKNGLSSLFAQKKNVVNPRFWRMIREIMKFKDDVLNYLGELENDPDIERSNETLGHFIESRGYSEFFLKAYLVPICGSIWSCSTEGVMGFSACSVLSVFCNHHLLQLFNRPRCLTVRRGSQNYLSIVRKALESRGCQIRTNSEVYSVSSDDEGCIVSCKEGSKLERFDGCIIAAHAPDALKMLGSEATFDEKRVLGAFRYAYSDIFLHRDDKLMPKNPDAWSVWNFIGSKSCVTYWLQNIRENGGLPYLLTLNPPNVPRHTILKWSTGHPVPSVAASKASSELSLIQGKRRIWFSGDYHGYGFHEDGLKAGVLAANGFLRKNASLPSSNPKHVIPSWLELGARLIFTRFLERFIVTGCLILLEDGGTMYTYEGTQKKCSLKVYLRIHSPQFYWKIAKEADIGLADAYINGDFSVVDKNEGLLNLFMILIANRELYTKLSNKRGWWTPLIFTSALSSAKYFYKHYTKQNTMSQARRNISEHYDLSNELFSLFMDKTMSYSCPIFTYQHEQMEVAQLRKYSLLIEKARIRKDHHILEIGCGWGALAIEVVKQTGCKYTGITLSVEQLKYVEVKVKEAGLQDNIKLVLCDYRELPHNGIIYDRIISCEMIEAVGHEFMDDYFACVESVLAEDGVFVLQFSAMADHRYDEERLRAGFITEFLFPGGCLPSLSRVTSAMANASRLRVEHVEQRGMHYYHTLRYWRENFDKNQRDVIALGFDERFIKTWEYYFDYCASGFKSNILGNYQIVFSRTGNVDEFGDPFKNAPPPY